MNSPDPPADLSRLCIHTMTTKPLALPEAIEAYRLAGVPAMTVWRQALAPHGVAESGRMLADSGLRVTSLCRGGFFPGETKPLRQAAIDDNRRAIEEAAAIGAPLVVLVCGAIPGMPLDEARKQIADGIAACMDEAGAAGIRLAIEPLHPMYADCRSAVNTMEDANEIASRLAHPAIGVAVDVYHLWWDRHLRRGIRECGAAGRLFAFHACDWRTPTRDLLNDRGLMGEGCIPIRVIRGWMEDAGFDGDIEVEIFSDHYWTRDQAEYIEDIKRAYLAHC